MSASRSGWAGGPLQGAKLNQVQLHVSTWVTLGVRTECVLPSEGCKGFSCSGLQAANALHGK